MAIDRIGRVEIGVDPEFNRKELFRQVESAIKQLPTIRLKPEIHAKDVNEQIRIVNTRKLTAIKPPVEITRAAMRDAIVKSNSRSSGSKLQVDVKFSKAQIQRALKEASAGTSVSGSGGASSGALAGDRAVEKQRKEIFSRAKRDIASQLVIQKAASSEAAASAIASQRAVELQRKEIFARAKRDIASQLAIQKAASAEGNHSAISGLAKVSSSFRGLETTIGRVLRTTAIGFTAWGIGVSAAVAGVVAGSIKSFADLEVSARNAATVFSELEPSLQGAVSASKRLKVVNDVTAKSIEAARQASFRSTFTAKDTADGLFFLASAGVKAGDAIKQIGPITQFAQAGLFDIAKASELLLQDVNATGEGMANLGRLSDLLSAANLRSQTTIEDLSVALANRAGSAFRAFKRPVSETIALLQEFGNVGVTGRLAGQNLAIVIREVVDAASGRKNTANHDFAQAFKDFGIQVFNAKGELKNFPATIDLLASKFDKLSAKEQALEFGRLGLTQRSSQALKQLFVRSEALQKTGSSLAKQTAELQKDASGTTARIASSQLQTFAAQLQIFKNQIVGLLQVFAAPAAGLLEAFFQKIDAGGKLFSSLSSRAKDLGKSLAGGIGSFLKGIKGSDVSKLFNDIVASIKFTIAGVRGFFSEFAKGINGGKSVSTLQSIGETIKAVGSAFLTIAPQVGHVLGQLTGFLIHNKTAVKELAKFAVGLFVALKILRLVVLPLIRVFELLSTVIEELGLARLIPVIVEVATAIGSAVAAIAAAVGAPVAVIIAIVAAAVGALVLFIVKFDAIKSAVLSTLSAIVGFFSQSFTQIAFQTGQFAGNIVRDILFGLGAAASAIGSFFSDLAGSIAGAVQRLFGPETAQAIRNASSSIADGFINELSNLPDDVASFFESIPGKIAGEATNLYNAGIDLGKALVKGFEDGLKFHHKIASSPGKAGTGIFAPGGAFGPPTSTQFPGASPAKTGKGAFGPPDFGTPIKKAADKATPAVKNLNKALVGALNPTTTTPGGTGGGGSLPKAFDAAGAAADRLQRKLDPLQTKLDKQKDVVDRLKTALDNLKNSQLAGTQAFSDQKFGIDQQVKALQLQQTDLQLTGLASDSGPVAALQKQIDALQLQSQKVDLTESLQLDPLRRKLDQTFNPIKEVTFNGALKQFALLTASHTAQSVVLNKLQARYDAVNASIKRLQQASQDFQKAQKEVKSLPATTAASTADTVTKPMKQATAAVKASTTAVTDSVDTVRADLRRPFAQGSADIVRIIQKIPAQAAPAAGAMIVWARAIGSTAGKSLVFGFEDGIRQSLNPKSDFYKLLHDEIPDFIRANKGPVDYDRGILVPAGQAVMEGLTTGLRTGFGPVKKFLNGVGSSMEESVPSSIFSKRTAEFMIDVAAGNNPDPASLFADLVPSSPLSIPGSFDPSLGFLHKTMSLADTASMAGSLAKTFGLTVTALKENHGKFTSSGNISDHFKGYAADLSNGVLTPQEDALAGALKFLFPGIIKQLIYRNKDQNTGAFIPNHLNHVHVAFQPDPKFSLDSGRIGKGIGSVGKSTPFNAIYEAASAAFHVPGALLKAITKQESNFNPLAHNKSGASGLMQLLPGTFASQHVGGSIFDPRSNIFAGAKYVSGLLKSYHGNVALAAAGYNAGPGNVAKYHGIPPFLETLNYVRKVLGFLKDFAGFRAAGGPVSSGSSYVVGERGPELFVPTRNGVIVPNHKINKSSRSSQVVNNYSITTASTDPDTLMKLMKANTRRTLSRVDVS